MFGRAFSRPRNFLEEAFVKPWFQWIVLRNPTKSSQPNLLFRGNIKLFFVGFFCFFLFF
jgi:hypothetical protein